MHKALYRKWRPAAFDDVCGQEHITDVLRYQIESGKLSHAYLFCGSRGTGKTTCAKILAKAVNCEDPQNGNPCGHCHACLGIESGSVTDVIEMDAASNNGVDDVRALRDGVVYAPSDVKYRVYIIDEVHMLSISAFNALLKTLEEPPPHVIFILATTELQKLPATIISRCQRYDFHRITVPVIASRLLKIAGAEGIDLSDGAAALIGRLALGGMRDAISMLELCAGESAGRRIEESDVERAAGIAGRGVLLDTARAVLGGDNERLFGIVRELYESSRDISVYWQDMIGLYRDMMIVRSTAHAKEYLDMTEAEYEDTVALAKRFPPGVITYHLSIMDKAYSDMQRGGMPKRLCAELALIRMADPAGAAASSTVAALEARVSTLEDKLSGGFVSAAAASSAGMAGASVMPHSGTGSADTVDENADDSSSNGRAESAVVGHGGASSAEMPYDGAAIKNGSKSADSSVSENGSSAHGGAERLLKRAGYFADLLSDYSKYDKSKTELLRLTRGFSDGNGGLVIRTAERFAMIMLDKDEVRSRLLSLARKYDTSVGSIVFELAEAEEDPAASAFDELAAQAESDSEQPDSDRI